MKCVSCNIGFHKLWSCLPYMSIAQNLETVDCSTVPYNYNTIFLDFLPSSQIPKTSYFQLQVKIKVDT